MNTDSVTPASTLPPFRCDLCGGTCCKFLYADPAIMGERFNLVACEKCGLLCTHPQPDADFLTRLYSAQNYTGNTISGRYTHDDSFSRNNHARVLAQLEERAPGRKILDVGCGAGLFLEVARGRGWDIYGLEPSGGGGEIARGKFGDRVKDCFLQDAHYPDAHFDAVTLWGVLEHVPSPAAILKEARRILKPGGILFLHLPNYRWLSLKRALQNFRRFDSGSISAHEHLYQFTSKTVRDYCAATGFTFLHEDVATPYYFTGAPAYINAIKRALFSATLAAFRLGAGNLGGILAYARHDGDTPRT